MRENEKKNSGEEKQLYEDDLDDDFCSMFLERTQAGSSSSTESFFFVSS